MRAGLVASMSSGIGHLLPWIESVVRWLVLLSASILVLFGAGAVLNALWSRGEKGSIPVESFVVIDSTGKLKNAENGLAQMLVARIDALQVQVRDSQDILERAGSARGLDKSPTLYGQSVPAESSLIGVSTGKVLQTPEVKFQGVDISGVLSWLRAQLAPQGTSLKFTTHISDGTTIISGDIRALDIKGPSTIWIQDDTPVKALNQLALELYRLKLAEKNDYLVNLSANDFGELITHLSEVADRRIALRSDEDQKRQLKGLEDYFVGVVSRFKDWTAMTIITGEIAYQAGDYNNARSYYQLELGRQQTGSHNRDEKMIQFLQDRINSLSVVMVASSISGVEGAQAARAYARGMIDQLAPAQIEMLRRGFQALYEANGTQSYAAIAGMVGYPNWLSWNHARTGSGPPRNVNAFLPWNRAFLWYFERVVRKQGGNSDFSLACWDWTQGKVPTVYADAKTPDGRPNPLHDGPVPSMAGSSARRTTRFPEKTEGLIDPSEVETLIATSQWLDFAGKLEDASDSVHGLTGGVDPRNPQKGGDMGTVATSAYDPLFYAHRCMVDRVWFLWQQRNGKENIDPKLKEVELVPFGLKVKDVLDIEKLGYTYPSAAIH